MCYIPQLLAKSHKCDAYVSWLSRQYRVQTGPGWYEPCLVADVSDSPRLFGDENPSKDAALAQVRAQGGWPGTISYAELKPSGPAPVKGKTRIVTAQTPKAEPRSPRAQPSASRARSRKEELGRRVSVTAEVWRIPTPQPHRPRR
jgi:hypothetical protein